MTTRGAFRSAPSRLVLAAITALAALLLHNCRDREHSDSSPDTPSRDGEAQRSVAPAPPARPDSSALPYSFIAVVDSGIDPAHPWFAHAFAPLAEVRSLVPAELLPIDGDLLLGRDLADDGALPTDRTGHGTHVAGIIVNELGLNAEHPAAPFRLLVLRTGNANHSLEQLTAALDHLIALKRAGLAIPLVVLPLEFYPAPGEADQLALVESALSKLLDPRTLAVAAAGNRGQNNDHEDGTRHCYPSDFPFPQLLSVASCNESGHLHPLSNFGALSVDLAAPGFGIESAWLDGELRQNTGSSQAAAFVAARAARLWAADPGRSPAAIKEALLAQVRLHPSLAARLVSHGFLPRETKDPEPE